MLIQKFTTLFKDVTRQGTKIPKEEYLTHGKNIIIDQGQDIIAGYTNCEDGIFKKIPAIVFGDHTRIIKYVDTPFFLGADGVKVLKCTDKNANYRYLYYALKNAHIPNTGYNRHFKWLKEITINYPDKNKQNDIVNILDKLEYIIKIRSQELDKFDELIKARFVEMFGDPVLNSNDYKLIKLSNLGTLSRGKSKHRPRNDPKLLGGPYPLIQTGDITNSGIFIKKYNNTYSKLGLKQSKMWPAGTLCITIAANIAQTAILSFDACFPDSVVGFIPKADIITTTYLHYWFSFFQKILDAQASQVAQKNINLKVLSNLDVAVPPITEQDKFLSFVQQVDKSKVAVQKSLDETQTLFDSLMQKYFR